MKILVKIFLVIPLVLLTLLSSFSNKCFALSKDSNHTYLIAGFDDAARNTDVLFLVNFNTSSNVISLIQIPRDSYFPTENGGRKVNGIYASLCNSGMEENDAMCCLAEKISDAFSIRIDGYIGISTDVFKSAVDAIGGIYVDIGEDFLWETKDKLPGLSLGENKLDGEAAMRLVRHRASYATADLGRLDAQKIFLRGLIETMRTKVRAKALFSAVMILERGCVANVLAPHFIPLALGNLRKLKVSDLEFLTMPGEACKSGNTWYYIFNGSAMRSVIAEYFGTYSSRTDDVFSNLYRKTPSFSAIYGKDNFPYKVYQNGKSIDHISN